MRIAYGQEEIDIGIESEGMSYMQNYLSYNCQLLRFS